ncbi:MAG: AzlD domain-containing protein [Treponema sp.]|nr:AzlD domain-containing protein [Treponema sp.]
MMNHNTYVILCIVIAAVITFLTRAIPFLLFGNRNLPPVISYLGKVLPPAIMVILVCYCLRHIDFFHSPYRLPEFIACAAVCIVHVLRKNMYLSIIAGTIVYMTLIRIM